MQPCPTFRTDRTIDTVDDFFQRVEDAYLNIAYHDTEDIWWRGQAIHDPDWRLVPKAFRSQFRGYSEHNYLHLFQLKAPARHSPLPPPEDYAGWMCFMQHYGVPTRLLDWTQSVLVAAFFAVEDDNNKDGAIWALSPRRLNKKYFRADGVYTQPYRHCDGRSKLWPLFKSAFSPDVKSATQRKFAAFLPAERDVRLFVQQACFTIHANEESLDNPGDSRLLMKFKITKACKPELRKTLRKMGIKRSTLFPDLDNLSRDLFGS